MYLINIMSELRIKNRSERDLRSCEATLKAVTNKAQNYKDCNEMHSGS